MVEIHAAGAVLWRYGERGAVEIALVHRPRYDDWSLPKGKLEPGESMFAGAVREVAEETGYAATLGRHLGRTNYLVSNPAPAAKVVDYFAARARSGEFVANKEVDELRWLPPATAENLLSYRHDLEIVRSFGALPADTAALLLVRHARAGSRRNWHGPDEKRPLTTAGWKQASAVHGLLPLFGPDRVHSAPLLRCVQTVEELAEDLDGSVITEPLLSEQGYWSNEKAGVGRVYEILMAGGTSVLCSQGGVIPDLLTRLAEDSGYALNRPESKKGTVWVLSFDTAAKAHPKLVDADYVPNP